jgi:predicted O-methyltransferase YrrM
MKFEEVDRLVRGVKFMKPQQARIAYDFLVENKLGRVLELGFAYGKSTCYLAAAVDEIGGDSHVLTIDRESSRSRSPNVYELLERCSLTHRATPVFAESSFTWELMKMLEQDPRPQFDFVYLDAGHTWDVTGYAFFLVDLLLAPGGWLLFDDMDWTIAGSKARKHAWAKDLPAEQLATAQVRKVFDLLVSPHPNYADIHEDEVWPGWGWARKRPARRGLLRRAS